MSDVEKTVELEGWTREVSGMRNCYRPYSLRIAKDRVDTKRLIDLIEKLSGFNFELLEISKWNKGLIVRPRACRLETHEKHLLK